MHIGIVLVRRYDESLNTWKTISSNPLDANQFSKFLIEDNDKIFVLSNDDILFINSVTLKQYVESDFNFNEFIKS